MNPHLTFASSIAAAISEAEVIPATIYSQGSTAELETPALGVSTEGAQSIHPVLHRGTLVLAYRFDPDATTAEDAGNAAQAAADWLASDPGYLARRSACANAGIWLRILGPANSAQLVDLAERSRSYEIRLPYVIQTAA